jgi:peptidyl-tRNA hydrolase, PTH1 family
VLVVGLGNPGREYEGTRHNVGAAVLGILVDRHDGKWKRAKLDHSIVSDVRIGGTKVILAFPQTYMNDSGQAVRALVRHHHVDDLATGLVVVHDELDLPLGRLKVKEGGGLAGHNGLRSIVQHLKDDSFGRVRIGIGKPRSKEHGAGHVLSAPSKRERTELDIVTQEAADAVELIITDGIAVAMNRYNTVTEPPP